MRQEIRVVRTPSGGAHLYFPGTAQRTSALPRRGLDFRAAGGCVIAPPSWSSEHKRCYQLLSDRPEGAPVDWGAIHELLQPIQLRPQLRHVSGRDDPGLVTRVVNWLEARPEGNRNYRLFWAAKLITAAGLMDSDTRKQLIAASLRSGLRGGEREARRTLASGERAGASGSPNQM